MIVGVEALGGYELDLPTDDPVAQRVACGRTYDLAALRVAAAVVRAGSVLDLGAGAGRTTVHLARAGATVVAVEPDAARRQLLVRNVERNGVAERVTVQAEPPVSREPALVALGRTDERLLLAARDPVARGAALLLDRTTDVRSIATRLGVEGHQRIDVGDGVLLVARAAHRARATAAVGRERSRAAAAKVDLLLHDDRERRELAATVRLRVPERARERPRADAVLVCLTTYRLRVAHAWITIETLLRQDAAPDAVVLVVSEEEFPGRELPRRIVAQQRRGLEVLWTEHETGSFMKLVPPSQRFPDATIVTVDDDLRYVPWLVSGLVDAARAHPDTIVGYRGWEIGVADGRLTPYLGWRPAGPSTPTDRLFLTCGAGTLYPPGLLPADLLGDLGLALRLTPTADDVWFWAVSRAAGVPSHCLGRESFEDVQVQMATPALMTSNRLGGNDVQLARVVEHFGFSFP